MTAWDVVNEAVDRIQDRPEPDVSELATYASDLLLYPFVPQVWDVNQRVRLCNRAGELCERLRASEQIADPEIRAVVEFVVASIKEFPGKVRPQ